MSMRARLDEHLTIDQNPSLFGAERKPGLVNVCADKDGQLHTYRRRGDELDHQSPEFAPFLWLSDLEHLEGLDGVDFEVKDLTGENVFSHLVSAPDWPSLKKVSSHIGKSCGHYASHPASPQLFIPDQAIQYLVATGQTYFNTMSIEEVKVLFLKVYTAGQVMVDPGKQPRRIVAVAMKEGFDGEVHVLEDEEDKLLWRLTGRVKKIDPDVILGHGLFNGDLEIVNERCKARKVRLDWGRTGRRIAGRKTRMQVAEKQIEYRRWKVEGRELGDSWLLAILHDVSGRELTGYELTDVAQHFGLEVGLRNDDIGSRGTKDLDAIAALHRTLLYPYFLQAQLFPLPFQNAIWRGNATRINFLFLREYYRRGHSIPAKPEVEQFAGGLTLQEHSGCAYGVYHCDVASLYPSLIISFNLGPACDELGIFKGMLDDLREFRLQAKEKERNAQDEEGQNFFGGLQTTFKILINSFYGYLGFGQGHFADFTQAAEVTRLGRELLQQMMAWLKERGGRILEVDTDGIYFVPSESLLGQGWLEELNGELPEGVNVEFDGQYPAMYCHKMKNYALLEEDGSLVLRGSGLRSRAMEPFLKQFIAEVIRAALTQAPGGPDAVFEDYKSRLESLAFSVDDLAKTETLIDSPKAYAKKIEAGGRNRAAVYELALAAERIYLAGDSISHYVIGDKASVTVYDNCKRVEDFDPAVPDINHKYYLKKLKAAYKKFEPILKADPLRAPQPV